MKRVDISLLVTVVLLTIFGLFMIYDVSSYAAFRDFGDKYHYARDQFFWAILGFLGLFFFANFNYHKLYNLSIPILLAAILLLVLVLIPGIGIKLLGARRWIDTGIFVLQPAEFVKLAMAIYLSSWFSTKEKGRFLAFILLLGFVFLLVMLQPDMGTAAVILSEALVIYFLSGGNIFYFGFLIPVLAALGYVLVKVAPYRLQRLQTFFNASGDVEATSYHVRQILIAFGSGGLFGVGLGNSLQKYAYLPESTTDSIFAIIAEELGFVGASFLILFFAVVAWRGFYIAISARDNLGKLMAGGITTFLAVQTIINLSAQTVLVPFTGIPLPFISYGGSALIVDLCAVGILLNISKQS
ncbi:MAG: Stage V sporulation protein E [uncultured bacterium]|nr:MAG: Stage V sporulation protein E [uncultured bacterium]OGH13834.1 MAG: cell division protein FtsW [Candidatus Levybacteria bacterium RIFCSPHIGHO2_01_FULL_38_26]